MTDKVGALEKTQASIDEGCFLTAPDDNGNTPIHLAALEGHCEIVTALLDLGAQVDDKNHIGETALHLAAKEGNEDVVKQLLKAGADPGLKTTGGGTAWHIAAAAGHLGILKLLSAHVNLHKIKDNASPRDIQNSVPKECSEKNTLSSRVPGDKDENVRRDLTEVNSKENHTSKSFVSVLTTRNVSSEAPRNNDKETAEDENVGNKPEAKSKDSTEKTTIDSLTSGSLIPVLPIRNVSSEAPESNSSDSECLSDSDDDQRPHWFFSNLFRTFASIHRRKSEIPPRHVLEVNANIVNSICRMKDVDAHATDGNKRTLLHRAAIMGAEYGVQRLLKKGADVNAVDSNGLTPLFLASAVGWPRIINLLLKAGASTTIKNEDGLSVLHIAVEYRQLEAVKELLSKVTPNIRDNHGRTPLHLAAADEENSIGIGQALIKAGAEVSPRDHGGFTPLGVARMFSNTAFCIFLTYQHKARS